ncbi:MAG: prepilin-type N-terminal cleavage/methylation domain-containing protein [Rubrivivax sp.]
MASPTRLRAAGFTLIELLVVVAIVAIGAALVSLTIRNPAETRLEHEAARLVALLEEARTQARVSGLAVAWVPGSDPQAPPFRFTGLPAAKPLPTQWLDPSVSAQVVGGTLLVLGPEAILPPQRLVLRLGERRLDIASDGLSAFAVVPPPEQPS